MNDTTKDDRYAAMEALERLCPQESLSCVVVLGDPCSKARPRFTKGGRAYTPRRTIEGEKRLASGFAGIGPFPGNVGVSCIFYRSSRQRVDVDNLLKAVLDAGTRASLWEDDSQVTAIIGILEHDKGTPRTVVAFGRHQSSLTRGEDAKVACETCGELFFPGGQRRETARWCSRACATYLADPVPCPQCGVPFRKKHRRSIYCSVACRSAFHSEAASKRNAAKTHCPKGHEYTDGNTHIMKDGKRRCRACNAATARRYRERKVTSDA